MNLFHELNAKECRRKSAAIVGANVIITLYVLATLKCCLEGPKRLFYGMPCRKKEPRGYYKGLFPYSGLDPLVPGFCEDLPGWLKRAKICDASAKIVRIQLYSNPLSMDNMIAGKIYRPVTNYRPWTTATQDSGDEVAVLPEVRQVCAEDYQARAVSVENFLAQMGNRYPRP